MSEGISETENKSSLKKKLDLKSKLDIKEKLDLDEMVGDIGVSMPSTDIHEYIRVLKLARKPSARSST
jgi:hypothetical protein